MAEGGFVYGGPTLLSHPLFIEAILPFLLIFAVVFAVLQKSRILGEGKKQIDAIVALVIGLIAIAFGQAVGIILQLMPFLAVSLVVLLVLMLLIGMANKEGDWDKTFPKGLRTGLMVVAIIAVVVAMLVITGLWDWIYDWWYGPGLEDSLIANLIFIAIAVGAVFLVWYGGKSGGGKDKKD